VTAHGDTREGKWRGNWRMEWVASTLHTTSEHFVSSITTADAHSSAASSQLNWRSRRFKWTRPFRRKTKSSFCACAITFRPACTNLQGGLTQITTGTCSTVVPHNLHYPRSRISLQKLTIPHLVKLPTLYRVWGFIAMFTTARNLSPPTDRSIQSTTSHSISLRSIFISSHLRLRSTELSLYFRFSHHKAECILFFAIRATRPANLILLNFIPRKTYGAVKSWSSSICNFLHSPITFSLLGPLSSTPYCCRSMFNSSAVYSSGIFDS